MFERLLFLKPVLHDLEKGQYWKQLFGWGLRVVAAFWLIIAFVVPIAALSKLTGEAPAIAFLVVVVGAIGLFLIFVLSASILWIRSSDILQLDVNKGGVFYSIFYSVWIVIVEVTAMSLLGFGAIAGILSLIVIKSPIGSAALQAMPYIGSFAGRFGWLMVLIIIPIVALYLFIGYTGADFYKRFFRMMDDVSEIRKKK